MTQFPTSDLRIATAVTVDDPATFRTTFEIEARRHVFSFGIADGHATLSMWLGEDPARVESMRVPIRLPAAGRSTELEFWHVDQRLSIHVNRREIAAFEYDWSARERLLHALNGRTLEQYAADPIRQQPAPPQLRWRFDGSGSTLTRVRVDRDLYYQPAVLDPRRGEQFPENGDSIHGLGFGTDPFAPGRIPPDHFLMLGDNSAASRDGRVWGRAHPLVHRRFGENDPFLVHRRLLLGKAWSVYFPAPMPIGEEGRSLVPDFGRLRFIR